MQSIGRSTWTSITYNTLSPLRCPAVPFLVTRWRSSQEGSTPWPKEHEIATNDAHNLSLETWKECPWEEMKMQRCDRTLAARCNKWQVGRSARRGNCGLVLCCMRSSESYRGHDSVGHAEAIRVRCTTSRRKVERLAVHTTSGWISLSWKRQHVLNLAASKMNWPPHIRRRIVPIHGDTPHARGSVKACTMDPRTWASLSCLLNHAASTRMSVIRVTTCCAGSGPFRRIWKTHWVCQDCSRNVESKPAGAGIPNQLPGGILWLGSTVYSTRVKHHPWASTGSQEWGEVAAADQFPTRSQFARTFLVVSSCTLVQSLTVRLAGALTKLLSDCMCSQDMCHAIVWPGGPWGKFFTRKLGACHAGGTTRDENWLRKFLQDLPSQLPCWLSSTRATLQHVLVRLHTCFCSLPLAPGVTLAFQFHWRWRLWSRRTTSSKSQRPKLATSSPCRCFHFQIFLQVLALFCLWRHWRCCCFSTAERQVSSSSRSHRREISTPPTSLFLGTPAGSQPDRTICPWSTQRFCSTFQQWSSFNVDQTRHCKRENDCTLLVPTTQGLDCADTGQLSLLQNKSPRQRS